jgi:hypothetical protein
VLNPQVDLEGINLIIDEADNIWSTYVDQDRPFIPLQREGELYELMGGSPLNNSRVRTISLVSQSQADMLLRRSCSHSKDR